jgi:hypothetical protein
VESVKKPRKVKISLLKGLSSWTIMFANLQKYKELFLNVHQGL